jgi:hypothetical protein
MIAWSAFGLGNERCRHRTFHIESRGELYAVRILGSFALLENSEYGDSLELEFGFNANHVTDVDSCG